MAVFIAAALISSGCGWKGRPDPSPTTSPLHAPTSAPSPLPATSARADWVIRPAQMRLYPTTRFTLPTTPCELDLRVELLDELGDPIKATGDWRIELHPHASAAPGISAGLPLASWDIPMRTREQNHQLYDRITRSYQLRLKINHVAPDQQPMWLTVTLMPTQGSRWQVQGLIDPQHGLLNP